MSRLKNYYQERHPEDWAERMADAGVTNAEEAEDER